MSRIAHPLFHTGEAKRPTSPKQLNIYATTWTIATELNALWHSRLSREGDDWTGRTGRKRGEAVTTAAKQRWEKRIRTPVEQKVKSQKACNPSIPGM